MTNQHKNGYRCKKAVKYASGRWLLMEVSKSRYLNSDSLIERDAEEICKDCFAAETERISEIGEIFLDYFVKNASSDGVLFKTIKEITSDNNIPHQSLSKVLKILEDKKVIYRRNGIIGLKKYSLKNSRKK